MDLQAIPSRALTHKVGPLPVWAWTILAGGGAFVLLHTHRGSSSVQQLPVASSLPVGYGGGGGGNGSGGSGDTSTPPPGTTTNTPPPSDTTPPPSYTTPPPSSAAPPASSSVVGPTFDIGGSPRPAIPWEAAPPGSYPAISASNASSAYDALIARLKSLGIAQDRSGYTYIDAGKLAAAPLDIQEAYATVTGQPAAGIGLTNTGQPAGDMGSFSGVVGTTGPLGIIYNVYREGKLVAAVPGNAQTDTVALGRQYGVAM